MEEALKINFGPMTTMPANALHDFVNVHCKQFVHNAMLAHMYAGRAMESQKISNLALDALESAGESIFEDPDAIIDDSNAQGISKDAGNEEFADNVSIRTASHHSAPH